MRAMRRLVLILLVALLAVPAAAAPMCAEQPVTTATMSEHHIAAHEDNQAPAKHAMPDHGCIGCATPMKAPVDMSALAHSGRGDLWYAAVPMAPAGLSLFPEPPPPRPGA